MQVLQFIVTKTVSIVIKPMMLLNNNDNIQAFQLIVLAGYLLGVPRPY